MGETWRIKATFHFH